MNTPPETFEATSTFLFPLLQIHPVVSVDPRAEKKGKKTG